MSISTYRVPAQATLRTRRGFTLIELLVALGVIGLVGSLIASTLIRQEKFYRGTSETLQARDGVRDAIEVLAADIRGLAVADTVRLMTDSAFEFFAGIGASVTCNVADTRDEVLLPVANGPRGNTLSSFGTVPDTGDVFAVYAGSLTKSWKRYRVASFSTRSSTSPCLGPDASMVNRIGFSVRLTEPVDSAVRQGAPVRFSRRGRYSVYHSSDGWYLGYRRCNALGISSCGSIQPLSGPYRPYSSNSAATGIRFDYFDADGHRLSPSSLPLDIARVDITARSESRERILIEHKPVGFADSASVSVSIRNR